MNARLLVRVSWFTAMTVALSTIAWLSPAPDRATDRGVYEALAQQRVIPECSELHCFRVLVPWSIAALPGSSLPKWKVYAAVSNAAAAVAVYELAVTVGLSVRGACLAMLLSAFGFGSLYTLHDSFTADPLMYLLGPLMIMLLLRSHVAAAGVAGAIGVFAKEFAAAPLWIFTAYAASLHDRALAARTLVWANLATILWLVLQLTLMIRFNYSYGVNASTDLLGGGYLAYWLAHTGMRGAASAIFGEFGALYLLAPVGFVMASPSLRRLALISLPVACVFAYVQQPDRALWNFHFLVTPLAALVLERTAAPVSWALVGCFVLASLRSGAQLPWVPASRYALLASLVLAGVATLSAFRNRAAFDLRMSTSPLT